MEGIDALNSWKPDYGHKIGNCVPQRPKRGQKSIGLCYVRTPLRFATMSLRTTKFELKLDIGYKEYSKLLVEIGTPEVNIYMKDFSFFFYFLKNGYYDFLKN